MNGAVGDDVVARGRQKALDYLSSIGGLSPDTDQALWVALSVMKWRASADKEIELEALIKGARSSAISRMACAQILEILLATTNPIPEKLAALAVQSLAGELPPLPVKRGRPQARSRFEESWIAMAVHHVEQAGLRPFRNDETAHRNSACDVVADCLCELGVSASYDTVKDIYKVRRDRPRNVGGNSPK